ncbi:MAG: SMI1/KNR4 family protein [Hyphomicrobiales bacterium]
MTIATILEDFPGEFQLGAGAGKEDIAACERALGVTFAGSFADYLKTYGWLSFGAHEVFGLGSGIAPWQRLTENNLSERQDARPPLPPFLVTFYNDGFGNQHCLDTRETVAGEHRIVLWNHELGADQSPGLLAPSFADWLRMMCESERDES